ncbi:hypothetical protein L195_g058090, partial [Trifolium pratense]
GTELDTYGIFVGSISKEVEQTGSAIELGKEEGDPALSFGATDPLKARLDDTIFTATSTKCATPIATRSHGGYK